MARSVTPISTVKPAAKGRKQTGSAQAAGAAPKVKSSRPGTGAKPAIASKGAAAISVPLGQVSKGELRAQIEKLEQVNTKLRAKNREAGREAKLSANRIAELEKKVAQLERRLKPKAAAGEGPEMSKTKTSRQRGLTVVPVGGAPSGASDAENTSLDRDAKTAGEAEAASNGEPTRERE
jgi:hypothetical protein